MGDAGEEGAARPPRPALNLLLGALRDYPTPVGAPAAGSGRQKYLPPIEAASAIYGRFFQKSADERAILEAFAAAAPRVFARCARHIAESVNAVADGVGRAPGAKVEREALMAELRCLAAVFCHSDDFVPVYEQTCETLRTMFEF